MIFARGSFIEIDEERCLNLTHRGVECNHCIGHCPGEAITFRNDHISLDTERCSGCGLCFSDCPTGVFHSNQWDETTVLKAVEKEKWNVTEIFCANHQAPYKQNKDKERGAIQLPACLSSVSKGGWYELGLITELELHREECEACPLSKALTCLDLNIGSAAEWLKASGKEVKISFIYKNMNESTKRNLRALETGLPVTSRRDLFISLLDRGRNELINKITLSSRRKPQKIRPGSYLPKWRKRLANVFPQNQEDISSPAYWPTIKINDRCVNCGTCSHFCPSGALKISLKDGVCNRYFTSGFCLDCRICQLICPQEAISRDREKVERPFEPQSIYNKPTNHCHICGSNTVDNTKNLCYWCEQEEILDYELKNSFKKIFC
jgi:Fe-S-cluster-containing hydrogenase component 2